MMAAILALSLTIAAVPTVGGRVSVLLGETTLSIPSRPPGLVICAVGVRFILGGLATVLPALPDASTLEPPPPRNTTMTDDASQENQPPGDADAQEGGDSPHEESDTQNKSKLPFVIGGVAAVLVLAVLTWFLLLAGRGTESTDDAFVDAHSVTLAPRVAGIVRSVHAEDNARVEAGDVLIRIDPAVYEAALANQEAAVAVAIAEVASSRAAGAVADASLEQARADAEATSRLADTARAARDRLLSVPDASSPADVDNATNAVTTAADEATTAAAAVDSAVARVEAAAADLSTAEARVQEAEALRQRARLDVADASVVAPVAGLVAQRGAEVGEYVGPGTPLLTLVPDGVFVTANFKETEITDMRIGQPVDIAVDAFPDVPLKGVVDSFQPGTGSVFALLPPQNATGNYVKVVQRVPVKITFTGDIPAQVRLAPGLSVVPTVDTSSVTDADAPPPTTAPGD